MAKRKVVFEVPKDMPRGCSMCGASGKICNICGDGPSACACEPDEIEEYVEQYGEQFGPCEGCQVKSNG